MPARSVAAALPSGWRSSGRENEKSFTLDGSCHRGGALDWVGFPEAALT